MPAIVIVNVSQTQAPTPNTLQGTTALLSQGATNTAKGTATLLTQYANLTPYLAGSKALTTLTQTGGLATATASTAHGFTVGDTLYITIAGATPAGYNGTFLCTVTTTTAFTYPVPSGTGASATGTLIYTVEDVAELVAMGTTWFAQGGSTAVYVLELGPGNAADGTAFLLSSIQATTPQFFYNYVVPRTWDATSAYLTFLANFESNTALTYFWTTTTLATYTAYSALMKCVVMGIEAPAYGTWGANVLTAISYSAGVVTATTATAHGVLPGQWFQIAGVTPVGYNGYFLAQTGTTGSTLVYNLAANPGAETILGTLVASYYASAGIPATEFSMAALAYVATSYAPSSASLMTSFNNSFLYGVTPFPLQGNSALLQTLYNANVSVVGTGAQGGISTATIVGGKTADGNFFNYWYSIDWANININLNLANAIINGANNPQNPLKNNQDGVDFLQGVTINTLQSGISFGLVFGSVTQTELSGTQFALNSAAGDYLGLAVVNAVPFATYYAAQPGNYKLGIYGGLSASFAPQGFFSSIIINLNATQFV